MFMGMFLNWKKMRLPEKGMGQPPWGGGLKSMNLEDR